ncbi:ABC transporter ATP-binding protein [Photorhabdus tasmaniensis]|uniref:ABC transporter ATP-binding protein n=1 Tax=Photorhabdus tasmaniensis TaxID=1004159 RepID=UPI00404129D7
MITAQNLNKNYKIKELSKSGIGKITEFFYPSFKIINALSDINIYIEPGTINGIIGLNGAGKSTLIKILTGVMYPTSGRVIVNGYCPTTQRKKYVRNIGVVFGQRSQLIWDLPISISFRMICDLYGVSGQECRDKLAKYTDLFDLTGFMNQPVRQLSLGQRMRAEIVSALLHSPTVLFLDEPTIGLDVLVKSKIRDAILELNKSEIITVILTSHDFDDIDELCSRLILLDRGKVRYDGLKREFYLKHRNARKIQFILDDNHDTSDWKGNSILKKGCYIDNNMIEVTIQNKIDSASDTIRRVASDIPLKDVSILEESLEDVVKKFYSDK